MPTGYTAKLAQGDQPFNEFIWECARAFGALVMLRDDSKAPIPDAFKPSSCYVEWLEKAEAKLARLRTLTIEQAEIEAAGKYDADVKDWDESRVEREAQRQRYETMLKTAKEWEPPTSDHVGLRDFMIEQLTSSIKFDCGYERPAPVRLNGRMYLHTQIAAAIKEVARDRESLEKEIERCRQRNEWLNALRASVPMPVKS